jgi:hypothetical protein
MYIVVWRNSHKEPHVSMDTHSFIETYSTYEEAKKSAEETEANMGNNDPWYFDYKIYEEASN